jgi:hypothetical protein
MSLVVTSPRAILVSEEGRYLANEPIRLGKRQSCDDRPVIADPAPTLPCRKPLPIAKITKVDREHAAGAQRSGGCNEGDLDGAFIRQIAEHVAHRYDRVAVGERITRQDQLANRIRTGGHLPCQFEHRWGCVRGDNTVACIDEVTRERTAPTSQFEDEPISVTNGLQQCKDAGRTGIGVEAEAQVVHQGEIATVIRLGC